jgi:hypothetical protein
MARAPVGPHDLVLCAHVGNLTAARVGDKFFYRELYPILFGRPYGSGVEVDDPVEPISGSHDGEARAYLAGFLRELVRRGGGWIGPFRKGGQYDHGAVDHSRREPIDAALPSRRRSGLAIARQST